MHLGLSKWGADRVVWEPSLTVGRSPRIRPRILTIIIIKMTTINLIIIKWMNFSIPLLLICVAKILWPSYVLKFLQQMGDNWVRSNCLTVGGFPKLHWETLQRLGYTEPPMYYDHEYHEDGMPKCEVCLHVPEHPLCPGFKTRCILAIGKELYDTCQLAARQALVEYCRIFEEDIEHTPARFFPMPN